MTTGSLFELVDGQTLGMLPWTRFFESTTRWTYEAKRQHQLLLLRALSSEFGLGVASWSDFSGLPLTSKPDLSGFKPHNPEAALLHSTSGSSGVPFTFLRDAALEAIDTAIFERNWRGVGWRGQPLLRLVSGDPKWAYYDSLRNVTPLNYKEMDESYVKWVVEHQPFLIHGVAGAIRDLCERLERRGHAAVLKKLSLYLMSEDTRSHFAALAPRCKGVFMGYGISECRTVASQCLYGTLHVNMETSIAESIDGELYVTTLFNKVMPFVRYKTGDAGEVVRDPPCRCGVRSDVIVGLEGKAVDYYYEPGMERPTGWWLVSPITHQYAGAVKAWRLEVVPSKKLMRVYAVLRTRSGATSLNPYLEWLKKSTRFEVELVLADELPDWRRKLLKVVDD